MKKQVVIITGGKGSCPHNFWFSDGSVGSGQWRHSDENRVTVCNNELNGDCAAFAGGSHDCSIVEISKNCQIKAKPSPDGRKID